MAEGNLTACRNCSLYVVYEPLHVSTAVLCGLILALTTCFGLPANTMVLYTFLRTRALRKTPNTLIASLSTIDLVTCTCLVPVMLVVVAFNPSGRHLGLVPCKGINFAFTASHFVTLFMLDVITLHRYVTIIHPFTR